MRKNWFIALVGAAVLALVPATALAQGHHAKRHHHSRTHIRHITAADSGTSGTTTTGTGTGTSPSSSDNAGKVTSFDGSKLVITLNDGSTVSGIVDNSTGLSCESASSQSGDQSSMSSDLSRDGGGDQGSTSPPSSGDQGSTSPPSSGDQGDQNDQGDQGDQGDGGNGGNGGNGQSSCSTSNLTPGTVVHEAELAVTSGGAAWRQVDLVLS